MMLHRTVFLGLFLTMANAGTGSTTRDRLRRRLGGKNAELERHLARQKAKIKAQHEIHGMGTETRKETEIEKRVMWFQCEDAVAVYRYKAATQHSEVGTLKTKTGARFASNRQSGGMIEICQIEGDKFHGWVEIDIAKVKKLDEKPSDASFRKLDDVFISCSKDQSMQDNEKAEDSYYTEGRLGKNHVLLEQVPSYDYDKLFDYEELEKKQMLKKKGDVCYVNDIFEHEGEMWLQIQTKFCCKALFKGRPVTRLETEEDARIKAEEQAVAEAERIQAEARAAAEAKRIEAEARAAAEATAAKTAIEAEQEAATPGAEAAGEAATEAVQFRMLSRSIQSFRGGAYYWPEGVVFKIGNSDCSESFNAEGKTWQPVTICSRFTAEGTPEFEDFFEETMPCAWIDATEADYH